MIGLKYSFHSQNVSINDFGLQIFGTISVDSHVGKLLGNIKNMKSTADVYGIYANYKYIRKSVYCGLSICIIDKDFGEEVEIAAFEISEDEGAYILPLAINVEALNYYSFDDLAKIAYWLGNFWVGVQYELNNRPEEIRIIEQRGPIMLTSGVNRQKESVDIDQKESG